MIEIKKYLESEDIMYPEELKRFLEERNYKLGGEDLLKVISILENPQLNHISYDPFTNRYKMWDRYGNYYEFEVIPYEKVKRRIK